MTLWIITRPDAKGRRISHSLGIYEDVKSAWKTVNWLNFHYNTDYSVVPVSLKRKYLQ